MKKYILLVVLSIGFCATLLAQNYTLKQSVDYALQNQEALKNLDIDRQLAEKKITEAYTTLFPQIKGVLDVRDNFVLPTSLIPSEAFGGPAGSFRAVQFGQQYNGTAALDATWTLYDPVFYPSLKSQRMNAELVENTKKIQENTIVLNVNRAYYSALLSQERIKLAQSILEKNKKIYEDTKVLYENNQTQELDLTRAKINFDNQQPELQRAQQLYAQSLLMLKFQMGYPVDSLIVLSDSMLLKNSTASDVPARNVSPSARPEYKSLLFQQTQEQINIRKYKLAYLPTVSLYGYAGAQSFRPKMDLFSGSSMWYGISYMGLKISVPVFDGTLKHVQTQESRLSLQKKQNEIRAFEKQFAYETQNAKTSIDNALSSVEVRKKNIEAADALLKTTQTRYSEGLVSYKEVVESKNTLLDAQVSYFNALYEYVSAKLEYDKILNQMQ